jgi:hypothetical protein
VYWAQKLSFALLRPVHNTLPSLPTWWKYAGLFDCFVKAQSS